MLTKHYLINDFHLNYLFCILSSGKNGILNIRLRSARRITVLCKPVQIYLIFCFRYSIKIAPLNALLFELKHIICVLVAICAVSRHDLLNTNAKKIYTVSRETKNAYFVLFLW